MDDPDIPSNIHTSFPSNLPTAYKPAVSLSKDELKEMAEHTKDFLADPNSLKLWGLTRALLHLQVLDRIASKVPAGRSGPNATLRAQREFSKGMLALVELMNAVGPSITDQAQEAAKHLKQELD